MIIVLVGLPGSGKTHLGKQLSKDLKIPYLEDIHILEYLPDNCIIDNPFKTQLINTGDCYIQENNLWNDTFFGYCLKTNQGKNMLGHLIMQIRTELQ
jgi:adenylate kinase family enzyme